MAAVAELVAALTLAVGAILEALLAEFLAPRQPFAVALCKRRQLSRAHILLVEVPAD